MTFSQAKLVLREWADIAAAGGIEPTAVEATTAILAALTEIEAAVAWGLSKTVVGLESPTPHGDQAVVAFGNVENDGRVTVTHCGAGATVTEALLAAYRAHTEARRET